MKNSTSDIAESFGQILDAMGDLVLVKGPDSRLLWANQAFCEFYGMSNSQLKGIIDATFREPDHTQKFVKDDTQVFTTGKILDIPEEGVNRFDGTVRIFHTVKTPIFDANKNVIMTVGVSRDITDRKIADESLRIERERFITSSKMAILGEMAGGVAHEINTPLTTLSLLAGQCEDALNDVPPNAEILKSNIVKIEKTTKKIAKIISGLRTFSRDGKNDPLVKTKVSEIIEDTLAFSRAKIVADGCKITVVHENIDLVAYCRATEISQVLLNLLSNSNDATATLLKKWIVIESKRVGGEIEISVTDSGTGLSESQCQKIFAPFYTTKETGKGTGLAESH